MSIRVGIVGISGYGGGEALRLCATHPAFEVTGRYYVPHFTALQITYFNGLGQYFLQYNKRSTGLRAGLCIWYWPDFAR